MSAARDHHVRFDLPSGTVRAPDNERVVLVPCEALDALVKSVGVDAACTFTRALGASVGARDRGKARDGLARLRAGLDPPEAAPRPRGGDGEAADRPEVGVAEAAAPPALEPADLEPIPPPPVRPTPAAEPDALGSRERLV